MHTPLRTPFLVALALPTLAFAACGGDTADTDDAASETDATTTSTTEAAAEAAPVGKGTGTFVVGDRTYSFEAQRCTAEEGDPVGTIQVAGKGTFDNRPFTVTVKSAPTETSVIETVQIVFAATESVVGTNYVQLPGGAADTKLQVVEDGKGAGTIAVSGIGGQPSGDGVLTLECEGA